MQPMPALASSIAMCNLQIQPVRPPQCRAELGIDSCELLCAVNAPLQPLTKYLNKKTRAKHPPGSTLQRRFDQSSCRPGFPYTPIQPFRQVGKTLFAGSGTNT
jgi:hypothetical protein